VQQDTIRAKRLQLALSGPLGEPDIGLASPEIAASAADLLRRLGQRRKCPDWNEIGTVA
jgi:hypothetical protein